MEPTKKNIGNINILDLRTATEETVATIGKVGNVNIILHSRATAGLTSRISTGNINATVETEVKTPLLKRQGQVKINREFFKDQSEPVFMLAMGQLLFEPDIPVKEIEDKLGGLIVMGQLLCPENLAGVIGSKTLAMLGQNVSYPSLKHTMIGDVTLDTAFLNGLEDGAGVAIVGDLTAPKVLDNALIEKKIGVLYFVGDLMVHEENAAAILSRMPQKNEDVEIIPAGFELVEQPLILNADLIDVLPAKKLYCRERLVIADDVTAAMLDANIEALQCRQMIVCPAAVRSTLAKKTNLLSTRVVFYDAPLWLVEDHLGLKAARLSAVKAPMTLVVTGNVEVDPEVSPDLLAARLQKVHNLGRIGASSEQLAVIEGLLGIRDGQLEDTSKPAKTAEPTDESHIGNIDYLAL